MHRLVQSFLPRSRENMINIQASPPTMDRDTIARAYARLFNTDDGKLVMAHLQGQTFLRMHTPETPDSHIRFTEGQRALVNTMLRFIAVGKTQ